MSQSKSARRRASASLLRALGRVSALVFVLALVAIPAASGTALASFGRIAMRPGGGGSYHGGGGGMSHGGGGSRGGGYSGGRSGSGWSSSGGYSGGTSYSSGSLDGFQTILVLVLIGGVITMVMLSRRYGSGNDVRRAIFSAQVDARTPILKTASLDALTARDPALTMEGIIARVTRMSEVLREAWCAGDMRAARPFVSDGVFSRFHVQLALMRAEGARNVMKDASVMYVTLEGTEDAPPLDVVHVRFTARARDAMVPLSASADDAARALAKAPLEPYTEIWSLVRRRGAMTKIDPLAVGRVCPSCGAPLTDAHARAASDAGGEMVKCRYCGAIVCSGEHDWVLAEITQECEWHPSAEDAPGLRALRNEDPGIASQVLEDRASYLFWKWIEAARRRSLLPLRKCATAEFLTSRAQPGAIEGARDVAVGGAELILVDPAPEDAPASSFDYAYVKIFWSASFGGASSAPVQSILRLVRRSGVRAAPSMTALVCMACGVPLTESDTPACDHCGAIVASGDYAWVLDAVEPPGNVRPRAPVAREDGSPMDWMVPNIADPRERNVLFAQMAAVVAKDGVVARGERQLLRACARRWGIPEATVQACLASSPSPAFGTAPGGGDVAGFTASSPDWFLAGLVAAALADGRLDPEERQMLDRAAAAMRLPPDAVDRQLAACAERLRRLSSAVEAPR